MPEPTDRLEAPDRIEWLELFFDLVVVAAVVFPLALAAVASSLDDGIGNAPLIWLLALPVGWQLLYAQRHSALLSLGKLSPS